MVFLKGDHMQNIKIKTNELQPEYRPDEKLLANGASALSDAELLAVILRTGSTEYNSVELARKILTPYGDNNISILNIFNYDYEDLRRINGVGKVKALQIKALAEISRRIAQKKARPELIYNNPETIARYYMEQLRHENKEIVLLLLLNSSLGLIKEQILSTGTVNASILETRDILVSALKYNTVAFILIHNHPSGNPAPSQADLENTLKIKEAAQMVGIKLLDHIIIGDNCYYSFMENDKYFRGA